MCEESVKKSFQKFIFIFTADGLKCYTCTSTVSEEDCSKNQKEIDCGAVNDRCATTGLKFTIASQSTTSFTKICTTKQVCDTAETAFLKACKSAQGTTCEFKCCDTDLCNGASSPTTNPTNSGSTPIVSIILMVSCAVAGFLR